MQEIQKKRKGEFTKTGWLIYELSLCMKFISIGNVKFSTKHKSVRLNVFFDFYFIP